MTADRDCPAVTAQREGESEGAGPNGPAPSPLPPLTGAQGATAVPPRALAPGSVAQQAALVDALQVLLAGVAR
jgi:hypothetical protein